MCVCVCVCVCVCRSFVLRTTRQEGRVPQPGGLWEGEYLAALSSRLLLEEEEEEGEVSLEVPNL